MYQFIHVLYKNQFNFQIMLPRPKEDTRVVSVSLFFIILIYVFLEQRKYPAFSGVLVVSGYLQNRY